MLFITINGNDETVVEIKNSLKSDTEEVINCIKNNFNLIQKIKYFSMKEEN